MSERSLSGATIVFDLDGTLVDTAPDLLRALGVVMAREGLSTPPREEMRRMVGQGARALIERAAKAADVAFPAEKLAAMTEDFVAIYAADIAAESRPFPHVERTLDALAESGAILSVCTNKRTGLSVQLLETLGLASRFAAIVGADSVPARKPSPDHYRAAVTAAGGDVARSLMVGDSAADVSAAKSADAPCIVVRFGYCEGDVERLGADVLIDSYEELFDACVSLLGAAPTGR